MTKKSAKKSPSKQKAAPAAEIGAAMRELEAAEERQKLFPGGATRWDESSP